MLAALAAFAGHAAVVYKWTDAAGVVHYSDQPEPGAEKIHTSPDSLNGAAAPAPARSNLDAPPSGDEQNAPMLGYTELAIASPVADQTFFGDEPIPVDLAMNPDLKPNHTLTWHLNGKELMDHPNATHFSLSQLERGTYAIDATVTDPQTGQSRSTASVTFFVRQPSELAPQHQKP